MPIALIGIGLPGSGKTTFLKAFAQNHELVYISKDELREELLGNTTDQSQNKRIWIEQNNRIKDALFSKKSIVLDATHIERWKRVELIALLRTQRASQIIGVYFNTPPSVARERNLNRDRVVADQVISWMEAQLIKEPPLLSEGFDALYTLETLNDLSKTFA